MRRSSLTRIVLSVHATCAGTNVVLAVVWSTWVLALVGAGWALVASLLYAFRDGGDPDPDAGPDEAVALPGS